MKVSVFTPTRGRPEALARCRKWIGQQTYPIEDHVVAEGGTLVENLMSGLPRITADLIVFAEDDDYYPPDWVETCVNALGNFDVFAFGDTRSHYYHLGYRRYRVFKHSKRASLSTTAINTSIVGMLLDACTSEKMIDNRFWRALAEQGVPRIFRDDPAPQVVGLKGGPGLEGLGYGHSHRCYHLHNSTRDKDYSVLRSLIGDEALNDLGVESSSQTQTPDQPAC